MSVEDYRRLGVDAAIAAINEIVPSQAIHATGYCLGGTLLSIAAARLATERELRIPLQLAFSYDEEIGCVGIRSLIEDMATWAHRPQFCIVGEPTMMQPIIAEAPIRGATNVVAATRNAPRRPPVQR